MTYQDLTEVLAYLPSYLGFRDLSPYSVSGTVGLSSFLPCTYALPSSAPSSASPCSLPPTIGPIASAWPQAALRSRPRLLHPLQLLVPRHQVLSGQTVVVAAPDELAVCPFRRLQNYQGATTPRAASLRLVDSPAGATPCLPAPGWRAPLCRTGVELSGSRHEVSDRCLPPFQGFPKRNIIPYDFPSGPPPRSRALSSVQRAREPWVRESPGIDGSERWEMRCMSPASSSIPVRPSTRFGWKLVVPRGEGDDHRQH